MKKMSNVGILREYARMCKAVSKEGKNPCIGCKIYELIVQNQFNGTCIEFSLTNARDVVNIICEWSKENPEKPKKTRQSEFLKIFPNTCMANNHIIINPCVIEPSVSEKCFNYSNCSFCREHYWSEEIE